MTQERELKRKQPNSKHFLYMDFMRVLACFLVIVNHTNSYVFQASDPSQLTWFLSIVWYYFSKIAVPIFVMVSGACLLPRQESYRRTGWRILRMVIALVLFSWLYYLVDLWEMHFTWEKAFDVSEFLSDIWQGPITDSFWYLYFYIGLLVMLPLLQRMAKGMQKHDYHYLILGSFAVNAFWPLLTHYVPSLTLPRYLEFPLMNVFIGLFFAGHYLHAYVVPKRWHLWASIAVIVVTLALSTALTALEFYRTPVGQKYWFMDERTAPALPILLCAMAVMVLVRTAFSLRQTNEKAFPEKTSRLISALGGRAFAIYLLQDLAIAESRYRVFAVLCGMMNPFVAALLWELLVWLVLLPAAWLLGRIPGIRKIV